MSLENTKILSINDGFQLPLGNIRKSYLVKFVDPQIYYNVNYNIKQDGTREDGNFTVKGEDLTENQILQLFLEENL